MDPESEECIKCLLLNIDEEILKASKEEVVGLKEIRAKVQNNYDNGKSIGMGFLQSLQYKFPLI